MVEAGNALLAGERNGTVRLAVTGYKGVGKSSLIIHALRMLREPMAAMGAMEPNEPQKWLVLRVSGKHVRGIDGLPDDLHRSVLELLSDTVQEAEHGASEVLRLSFWHKLFPSRERELYDKVRTALMALTLTVEFVRAFSGAKLSERGEEVRRVERSVEIRHFLETQLQLRGKKGSTEGKAALGLSENFLGKWAQSFEGKRTFEQETTVNADLATEALNGFFRTTRGAGIPTLLVLDDFDELVSGAGPSHSARAKALMEVLGVFNQLAPTCLVIAMRQEYAHEDMLRQFTRVYVPPMGRDAACEMLDAWTVKWGDASRSWLRDTALRFLRAFPEHAPVVVPDSFLPLLAWVVQSGRAGESIKSLLDRYLRLRHDGETVRAVSRLARALSDDDAASCAETIPLDPTPYALLPAERLALEKNGLLRPAMAWNDEDTRVIIDPLVAYLHHAERTDAP